MANIRELLKNVNGGTFISIDTITPVTLKGGKSNPFQGRVTKEVTGSNVMVFQNKTTNAYENMVNRRLNKEGKSTTFEVGPRAWGTRIANTPFVEHKGQLYLEVIFLAAGERRILVDGRPFNGTIQGMDEKEESAHQGGLNDKVIIRTYNVAHIERITVDGVAHTL
jgi:hypothetical protein